LHGNSACVSTQLCYTSLPFRINRYIATMTSSASQLSCQHRIKTFLHSKSIHTPQQNALRHFSFKMGRSHAAQVDALRLVAARCSDYIHNHAATQPAVDRAHAAATTGRQNSDGAASAVEQLTQRLVWASAALTLASFAPDIVAGTGAAPLQIVGSGWPPWLVRSIAWLRLECT
jgi:hypothetical protein